VARFEWVVGEGLLDVAVVDGDRFLGVVTPASILALTTRLR
jgi:hypothetical protein